MNKLLACVLLLFLTHSVFAAPAERSDSINIRKTTIKATITDFTNKTITAHTQLDIQARMAGIQEVIFDLESLVVDSVKWNGQPISFNHVGISLKILTPSTLNVNDSALVDVYYHGVPISDVAWGGFYFNGNYAFNMGVGFNAQPHNFGRTWYPCFDNFVERSTYEFYIRTTPDKMAITNGLFLDSVIETNGDITWHYKLDEEIPSYLSSVAVSNYVWVKRILNGNAGTTPAWIGAQAVDTTKVNGSFGHLQESFSMLEQHFGTHSFPKVGYTLVPFTAGAMEHATNIHIGNVYVDGSLTYETLIAHELAHHWWGDLVTCRTAQDMWLNEGWASYAESLHEEYTYGKTAFHNSINSNHFNVLSRAHISDNGYRAISPMDSNYTYGPTVYNKGALAAHTLRSYLGDNLFFSGTTAFLNAHKFQDISSNDLKDFLSTHSGQNLTPFFNEWIFQAGFPHFSIDSSVVSPIQNGFSTSVFIRHRKHQATNYYTNVPLEIAFYDAAFVPHIYSLRMTNRCMEFKVELPFSPTMIVLDPDFKLGDASTSHAEIVKTTGVKNFANALTTIYVQNIQTANDSSLLHVEHHWIMPDRFKAPPGHDYVLHDKRYWEVKGINLANLNGLLRFTYSAGSANHYLDSTWLKTTEDNIRLFYRRNASEDWVFANDSLRAGSLTDRSGNIFAKEIKEGEYCLGIKRIGYIDPLQSDIPSGPCGLALTEKVIPTPTKTSFVKFYPNPVKGQLFIQTEKPCNGLLELFDLNGQKVFEREMNLNLSANKLELPTFAKGNYIVRFSHDKIQHSETLHLE